MSLCIVRQLVALTLSSPRTPAAASGAGVLGRGAPIRSVRPTAGILARGLIAKRAVRATFIVFDTPTFQDNPRLLQIAEEFAVKAFIAQLVVKALKMPVFPRAPFLMLSV
jgi:hypothetical protein